jgi:hypothetical protein
VTRRTGASGPGSTGASSEPPRGALVSAVERAARLAGRRTPTDGAVNDDINAARALLSTWLVQGREARGLVREQVARITRIPMRTVEALEEGRWDELPADVFVRGFLHHYARCVGLPVDEALARYSGCGFAAAPVASAQARALLDSMASLAPVSAGRPVTATPITSAPRVLGTGEMPAVPTRTTAEFAVPTRTTAEFAVPTRTTAELAAVAAPTAEEIAAEAPKRRTASRRAATVPGIAIRERDARGRFIRKSVEMAAVVVPEELRALADALDAPAGSDPQLAPVTDALTEVAAAAPVEAAPVEVAPAPVVEPIVVAAPVRESASVRVVPPRVSRPFVAPPPSLVIDDDHPEDAERAREDRARAKDGGWRSFLPPALLDQERGSRQGGLTLAVIILLIVATLTLSYLMRRPSSTGEGITQLAPTAPIAATIERA